ncbi:MAG TPA: hypothetical protein VF503_24255 [Sphingobium sp.]|uniref:hypothetical protein n=1 Tax=Sphingobium sp. TaxID=1912891 RepID=UPI002ED5A0EC
MDFTLTFKVVIGTSLVATLLGLTPIGPAQAQNFTDARRAAVHPVSTVQAVNLWLSRVPRTRDFPPDFAAVLSGQSSLYIIEMSTAPGCIPCADLWTKLGRLRARYGWQVRTISGQEALLRAGKLGLPWVGHPVAWARPLADQERAIPIAIGTDHEVNIARNAYLAAKMLTGVRPAVGLRAMAKYTGIVGPLTRASGPNP